jgi:tetratricopeptide (TPR) repeat protein
MVRTVRGVNGTAELKRCWWLSVAVFIGTLLVFAPALRNGWTGWDDTAYVLNNPLVKDPGGPGRIWTSRESEQYYPLTFTSYWVQYRFFGDSPAGYHAVNVVLHALNAVLCLGLARRLGLREGAAALAAALFAVHPIQVMSVAWIAEHKNTLSGMFALLAMTAWVRSGEGGRWRWYGASVACLVLAMLAKTAVVGLPVSLVALDYFTGRRVRAVRVAPVLLVGAVLGLVTYAFEQKFMYTGTPEFMPGIGVRVLVAGAAPWAYLWHIVYPVGLSPAYGVWDVSTESVGWWLASAATIIASIAVVGWGWRVRLSMSEVDGPLLRVPAAWAWGVIHFLAMLGPTLGLIPFGNLVVTSVSDHFLYSASLGIFLPLGRTMGELKQEWKRVVSVAWGFVLVVLAALSASGTRVYRDAISLWSRVLEVAPENYAARLGLGEGYRAAGRRDEAMDQYRKALAIKPNWPDGWLFLGRMQKQAGRYEEAEESFRRVLSLASGDATAMTGLAEVLEITGRVEEALTMFEKAVATNPRHGEARLGLAKMYLGYSRHEDALAQFREYAALRPTEAWGYLGMAQCLRAMRKDREAVETLLRAGSVVADDLALVNMHARILATTRDDSLRDPVKAEVLARRAVELSGGGNPFALDTLAAALAASGKSRQATETARRAAAVFRQFGQERNAQRSEEAARRYEAGEVLLE